MGVQEHRRETQIGDADLLKHDNMKNQRTPRGSGNQKAFLGVLVVMSSPQWVLKNIVGRRWSVVFMYKIIRFQKNREHREDLLVKGHSWKLLWLC